MGWQGSCLKVNDFHNANPKGMKYSIEDFYQWVDYHDGFGMQTAQSNDIIYVPVKPLSDSFLNQAKFIFNVYNKERKKDPNIGAVIVKEEVQSDHDKIGLIFYKIK